MSLDKIEKLIEELTIRDAEVFRIKQEMEDFFENNNVPMHQVNSNGIIVRANKSELDALGYLEEDYIGQPIAQFHNSQELIQSILVKLINHDEIWKQEANIICKDGTLARVSITSSRGKDGLTRCISIPV